MHSGILSHGHLVLAALHEGDVLLTDLNGQPLPFSNSELMAPSAPRPVLAHIRDVATGQRVRRRLYDAKDLTRTKYVRYLAAAAAVAGPSSAYWLGL